MADRDPAGGEYAVIELLKGPAWTPGVSISLIRLQLRHLRTLWRLRRVGLVLVAAPVTGREPLRGLVVAHRRDLAAVLEALARDPAIRTRRLATRVASAGDPDT